MIRINLLPPQRKKEINLDKMNRWLIFFGSGLLILILIFVLLALNSYFYLLITLSSQQKLIDRSQGGSELQEVNQLEEEINQANQKIDQIYNLQSQFIHWTPVIEELIDLTPSGIYFTNFSYQQTANQVQLSGHAKKREDLLQLKKSIESSQYFQEIESPLTNLLKQEDIDFNLNFNINTSTAYSI